MKSVYQNRLNAVHNNNPVPASTYEGVTFENVQRALHEIAYMLDVQREGTMHEVYEDTAKFVRAVFEDFLEELRKV